MKKNFKILLVILLLAFSTALLGCGKTGSENIPEPDLNEIMASMNEKVELPDMMYIIEEDLMDIYGIDSGSVEQFCGCILGDGISPDEIVMIKARDEESAKHIKDALESRLKNKMNEAKGYNPDAYALMQKSIVSIKGVYAAMIVSPDQDTLVSVYDSFFK